MKGRYTPWSRMCGGWRPGEPGLRGAHTEGSPRPSSRPGWGCPATGSIFSRQTFWLCCRQSTDSTRKHSNLQNNVLKRLDLSLTWFRRCIQSSANSQVPTYWIHTYIHTYIHALRSRYGLGITHRYAYRYAASIEDRSQNPLAVR